MFKGIQTRKRKEEVMFEVIVIGGGHAGCEAAAAAARIGAKTLLITKKLENIGQMSCNPAFGGVAKGIVVKEIDALDGVMPRAIDLSSIHSKILNKSKGAAVWGPRAQADRELYQEAMVNILQNYPNLEIKIASVEDLIIELTENEILSQTLRGSTRSAIKGVIIEAEGKKEEILAHAVILTTGTFLNGVIHIGNETQEGGRYKEKSSIALAYSLRKYFRISRLKTGTPPRLNKNTIDFSGLEPQFGDSPPRSFSQLTKELINPQVPCYITYTSAETHAIIAQNIHLSAIHNGIKSKGPRYCPSIEDKITRFSNKERHQIFLEPEGLSSNLIYPNGISNSLPREIQEKFIRTIKGLENVEIIRYGYNIEYDYIDSIELYATLETKKIKGLFFAGQINGTTGYEEAGGQGLIAGVNAAYRAKNIKEKFILSRADSYIGVMIDDLTQSGVGSEPYRLFTSRAEYRLSLRADNADDRLTSKGFEAGLVRAERYNIYLAKLANINTYKNKLKDLKMGPNKLLLEHNIKISQDGIAKNALELLKYPKIKFAELIKIWPELREIPIELQESIETEAGYAPYLEKQAIDIKLFQEEENIKIPENFNFDEIKTLSNEVREKLKIVNPKDIAAAKKIVGVTPAAVMSILICLRYKNKGRSLLN